MIAATGRAPLFLAERVISQIGGLAFTAALARMHPAETAAEFLAAYALASLLQAILANACAPLAARIWLKGGDGAALGFIAALQLIGGLVVGLIAIASSQLTALILLHAMLAPAALLSTPLVARDRFKPLLAILISVNILGVGIRLYAVMTGDLALAALGFCIEPLLGGALFAAHSGWLRRPPRLDFRLARRAAPRAGLLALSMGCATLFWRSPILLADIFLDPVAVVQIALALQIVMGLCLPANALCQALFGPLTRGDRTALGIGVWTAFGCGAGAILLMLACAEPLMRLLYGGASDGAAVLAILFAPVAGFAALWRIEYFAGGLEAGPMDLVKTRLVAIAGQLGLALCLLQTPDPLWIAALTPLSMAASALIAPFRVRGLRPIAKRAISEAVDIGVSPAGRRRAIQLLFGA
ncbi:MAG: hypothetical protein AAF401_00090 [Pseudomonadota bacterium]